MPLSLSLAKELSQAYYFVYSARHKRQQLMRQLYLRILIILLFLYAWVSVNIYLPALPQLVHDFQTSAYNLKLSITLFLGGYALSQLIWGPLSEKHGRRKTLILGMLITSAGVLITLLATNVIIFNSGRLIEALGLGCASVLGRAILVDTLDSMLLLTTMTYATIVVNIMPAIAPIIGGNLLQFAGWRSIFLFLLIYSLLLLYFFVTKLPETHKRIQKDMRINDMLQQYGNVMKNTCFLGYVTLYALVTGAMIGYYALAPFLFIQRLHIPADVYGYLGLLTVASYLVGAFLCRALTTKFNIDQMLLLGTTLLLMAAVLIIWISFNHPINIISVLTPMACFTFCAGLLAPNTNTGAMKESAHNAGGGAAILSFAMYAGAAVFSSIATALPLQSLMPLGIYIASVAVLAAIIFWSTIFIKKPVPS